MFLYEGAQKSWLVISILLVHSWVDDWNSKHAGIAPNSVDFCLFVFLFFLEVQTWSLTNYVYTSEGFLKGPQTIPNPQIRKGRKQIEDRQVKHHIIA